MLSLIISLLLYPGSVVFGYFFGYVLGIKNLLERVAVGWLLGISALTYFTFLLYDYFGVRFTWQNTIAIYVFSLIVLILLARKFAGFTIPKARAELQRYFESWKNLRAHKAELLLVFLIFMPVLFTIALNMHWPVADWDAIALYDFRAKVFALSGGMEDGIIRGYFLHYPLYTSMLHMYTYLFGLMGARTWYTLFYLATLFTFYELLQRYISRKYALLGTFLLAISPRIFQHAQMTYTNLPHAVFVAYAYMYLWEWWHKGKKLDLVIGTGMIAASMWVRLTEPYWVPALFLLVAGGIKWRKSQQLRLAILAIVFIFAFRYPWTHFVAVQDHLSITNPFQIGKGLLIPANPVELLDRIQQVNDFFWMGVYPLFSDYVPPIIIAALYLIYKEKWVELWEYGWFFFFVLFVYAGIFVFSFEFAGWQLIPDSAARSAMFLLPISIYLIMKSELWQVGAKSKVIQAKTHLPKKRK